MAHINFYHLNTDNPEKSACQLLEKCYNNNFKIIIRVLKEEKMESLNRTLWTFAQKSFIPHGSANDQLFKDQKIYITTGLENPINANMLMVIGNLNGVYEDFDRIFILFETEEINSIKDCYKKFSTASNIVNYYKQDKKGIWEKSEIE